MLFLVVRTKPLCPFWKSVVQVVGVCTLTVTVQSLVFVADTTRCQPQLSFMNSNLHNASSSLSILESEPETDSKLIKRTPNHVNDEVDLVGDVAMPGSGQHDQQWPLQRLPSKFSEAPSKLADYTASPRPQHECSDKETKLLPQHLDQHLQQVHPKLRSCPAEQGEGSLPLQFALLIVTSQGDQK